MQPPLLLLLLLPVARRTPSSARVVGTSPDPAGIAQALVPGAAAWRAVERQITRWPVSETSTWNVLRTQYAYCLYHAEVCTSSKQTDRKCKALSEGTAVDVDTAQYQVATVYTGMQ